MNRLTRPFSFVSRFSTEEVPYVPQSNEVVEASFGDNASFFVKENGSVYFAGTNTNRCSGLGGSYPDTYTTVGSNPVKITYFSSNNIKITQVATTSWGTFFLSDAGVLYYAGDSSYVTGSAALFPTVVPASYSSVNGITTFYNSNMGNVSNIRFSKIKSSGALFGAITTTGALCVTDPETNTGFYVYKGLEMHSLQTTSTSTTSTFSRNIVDFELRSNVRGSSGYDSLLLAIDTFGLLWKKGGGSSYWGGTHTYFGKNFSPTGYDNYNVLRLVEGPHASNVGGYGALDTATLTGVKVTSIALGNYYAIVTTSNGELWGQGESYRFGGSGSFYLEYTKINSRTVTQGRYSSSSPIYNTVPTVFGVSNIRSIAGGLEFPYVVTRSSQKDIIKHAAGFGWPDGYAWILEDVTQMGQPYQYSHLGPYTIEDTWLPEYHGWAPTGNHWVTDGTGFTGYLSYQGNLFDFPKGYDYTTVYGRDHLAAIRNNNSTTEPPYVYDIELAQSNFGVRIPFINDTTGLTSSAAYQVNNYYDHDSEGRLRWKSGNGSRTGQLVLATFSNSRDSALGYYNDDPFWDETAKYAAPSSAGDVVPKVFAGDKTFGFVRNRVLYVWGMNRQGQTGVSSTDWVVGYPKAVTLP